MSSEKNTDLRIKHLETVRLYLLTVEKITDIERIFTGKVKAARIYLQQFEGEIKAANNLALQAYLSMDYSTYDFAKFSVEIIEAAKKKGIEARNYFEILKEVI